jgi:Ni/Fe-hydrogenase subunit HybB-like protein
LIVWSWLRRRFVMNKLVLDEGQDSCNEVRAIRAIRKRGQRQVRWIGVVALVLAVLTLAGTAAVWARPCRR